MKNITIITLSIVTIAIITISCKKEATPSALTGGLQFHLHTNVGSNEVDSMGLPYKDTTGRQIIVDTAQLYISNIQLIGNNNTYSVLNKILFKVQPLEPYTVGQVPVGQYQSVKYDVGLDSITNTIVPNASDTALYNPTMYLAGGSTPQPDGYTFIYFSGYIDTTANKSGNWLSASSHNGFAKFSYKIGTNKNLGTITMPNAAYTIAAGSIQEIHMVVDYAMLFTGIDVTKAANLTINLSNAATLGHQAAQNIQPNVLVRYEY